MTTLITDHFNESLLSANERKHREKHVDPIPPKRNRQRNLQTLSLSTNKPIKDKNIVTSLNPSTERAVRSHQHNRVSNNNTDKIESRTRKHKLNRDKLSQSPTISNIVTKKTYTSDHRPQNNNIKARPKTIQYDLERHSMPISPTYYNGMHLSRRYDGIQRQAHKEKRANKTSVPVEKTTTTTTNNTHRIGKPSKRAHIHHPDHRQNINVKKNSISSHHSTQSLQKSQSDCDSLDIHSNDNNSISHYDDDDDDVAKTYTYYRNDNDIRKQETRFKNHSTHSFEDINEDLVDDDDDGYDQQQYDSSDEEMDQDIRKQHFDGHGIEDDDIEIKEKKDVSTQEESSHPIKHRERSKSITGRGRKKWIQSIKNKGFWKKNGFKLVLIVLMGCGVISLVVMMIGRAKKNAIKSQKSEIENQAKRATKYKFSPFRFLRGRKHTSDEKKTSESSNVDDTNTLHSKDENDIYSMADVGATTTHVSNTYAEGTSFEDFSIGTNLDTDFCDDDDNNNNNNNNSSRYVYRGNTLRDKLYHKYNHMDDQKNKYQDVYNQYLQEEEEEDNNKMTPTTSRKKTNTLVPWIENDDDETMHPNIYREKIRGEDYNTIITTTGPNISRKSEETTSSPSHNNTPYKQSIQPIENDSVNPFNNNHTIQSKPIYITTSSENVHIIQSNPPPPPPSPPVFQDHNSISNDDDDDDEYDIQTLESEDLSENHNDPVMDDVKDNVQFSDTDNHYIAHLNANDTDYVNNFIAPPTNELKSTPDLDTMSLVPSDLKPITDSVPDNVISETVIPSSSPPPSPSPPLTVARDTIDSS